MKHVYNSSSKAFVWWFQCLDHLRTDICWLYFLLRIVNTAPNFCVVNLWVLLNSSQDVDFIILAGNQSDWVQTAGLFLIFVAVVPMLIWVWEFLLCCFGSIPYMSLSGARAMNDTVVQISKSWPWCFGLILCMDSLEVIQGLWWNKRSPCSIFLLSRISSKLF